MALITCPHCGKNVSDSVEVCIHCGGSLKEKPVPEKEREYAALPIEEQKSLRKEFDTICPEFPKNEKKGNIAAISYIVALVVFFVCGILMLVSVIFVESDALSATAGCLGLLAFISTWVLYFYSKFWNKKRLTCLKRYQKWLKQEKNIHYSVVLEAKDRKIFDQISIN